MHPVKKAIAITFGISAAAVAVPVVRTATHAPASQAHADTCHFAGTYCGKIGDGSSGPLALIYDWAPPYGPTATIQPGHWSTERYKDTDGFWIAPKDCKHLYHHSAEGGSYPDIDRGRFYGKVFTGTSVQIHDSGPGEYDFVTNC
jgi:hypothetical protein